MKTILTAVAITFFGKIAFTQTFTTYADTANYLIHEIERKKVFFVGKTFSALYDSLKVKPIRFSVLPYQTDFGKKPTFYFNLERIFSRKHFVTIEFESVPTYNILYPIFFPPGGEGSPMNTIINTYSSLIIKDITVKDYSKDEDIDPGVLIMKAPKKKK